jgi:GWxTD domain-containing protein
MRFPAPLLLLCALCGQTLAAPVQTQASPESPAQGHSQGRVEQHRKRVNDTPTFQKWANEDVRWIITPEERAAFLKLHTPEQKEQFIEQFWALRDPTPDSRENEFKDEHYRRIAYSNEHFGVDAIPGWESDRGRVYIVLGPPDEIEFHPGSEEPTKLGTEGATPSFPYQIWRYPRYQNGHDLFFRFVDYCRCGDYRNTSGTRVLFPRSSSEQPAPPGSGSLGATAGELVNIGELGEQQKEGGGQALTGARGSTGSDSASFSWAGAALAGAAGAAWGSGGTASVLSSRRWCRQ